MTTVTIDGKEVKEALLEKLIETIEESNKKMAKYTKWLCWLTIAIGVIAILQLTTMLVK